MSSTKIILYPQESASAHLRVLIARAQAGLQADAEAAAQDLRRALDLIAALGGVRRDAVPGALAPWRASRVARHVEDHLDARLDVGALAAVAGLSVRQFSRAFKARFGLTPVAYVQGVRLARVRGRLLTCDEPLWVTARACGFSDQTQLCRVFRHATGHSPKAWRRWRTAGADTSASMVSGDQPR